MSIYSIKGKGWRYEFEVKGQRYTGAWFKTKKAAKKAQEERKEEILNPKPVPVQTTTDMGFLDLVNRRLDHLALYGEGKEGKHYKDCFYMARRWISNWESLNCSDITKDMILDFVKFRAKEVSNQTGNKEIRYLKAVFNFGKREGYIEKNPVDGIRMLPNVNKRKKPYIPSSEDVDKVIDLATPEVQDYLWVVRETLARVGEVNRLEWDDVDFETKTVTLYTRKKRGGNLTPRDIPMTDNLYQVLHDRYDRRDPDKPWVFWHTYFSKKAGKFVTGPYKDRKKIMRTLCKKAGIKYFRYHPIRHSGATILENENVPIKVTQSILGHENRKTTEIYLHTVSGAVTHQMV